MKVEYLLTGKITDSYVKIIMIDIDSIIQSCLTLNEKAAFEQYSLIISLMMYIWFLVFFFGVQWSIDVHRCWCEIIARAENFLDFVHRFSLGLGDDEKHEERTQHAEQCE